MCAIKAKHQAGTAQPARSAAFAYPVLLPLKEAAQRAGIKRWSLRRLVYARKVTHYKLNNRVMIAEEDVQRLIAKSKVEAIG